VLIADCLLQILERLAGATLGAKLKKAHSHAAAGKDCCCRIDQGDTAQLEPRRPVASMTADVEGRAGTDPQDEGQTHWKGALANGKRGRPRRASPVTQRTPLTGVGSGAANCARSLDF
jgi:hypothetical protein